MYVPRYSVIILMSVQIRRMAVYFNKKGWQYTKKIILREREA